MVFGWNPEGQRVDQEFVDPIVPDEILYELDGPMIFTFVVNRRMHLAYMCGDSRGLSRFTVASTNDITIKKMKDGEISVREALYSPWLWCMDLNSKGEVESCWATSPEELPSKALPPDGVMIDPELEPVFSVRVEGSKLSHDNVPASVIKRAVDGAYTALKKMSEEIAGGMSAGRPAKAWKQLFDLPAQHARIGSFEIAFKEPQPIQSSLPDIDDASEQLKTLGHDFSEALSWAVDRSADTSSPKLQLLEAMEKLVPPQHGLIERVYIGGSLISDGHREYVLDRDVTKKVRKALISARDRTEQIITLVGEPRELDKDRLSFRLRTATSEGDYTCTFQEDMYEDVLDAFTADEQMTVSLRAKKSGFIGEVIAILRNAPEEDDDKDI